MKRLVMLLTMTIVCFVASGQTLTQKVKKAQEKALLKHRQSQGKTQETQATVATQQAAITTQANVAVAKAQQQVQDIDRTYTAEELAEQYSRKPTVPAGPHTATNYSQKKGQGIKFGKGAGKGNEVTHIEEREIEKNNVKQQGQWGTIGGNGNSNLLSS